MNFNTLARQYLQEKIPELGDQEFDELIRKLLHANKNTQTVMMDPPFFEDVDLCYNSEIDGKSDDEKLDQFVRLYLSAPRPLQPSGITTEEAAKRYLTKMIAALRENEIPPVNVIQLLYKGKVYKVISNGRTRAAAAKVSNTKIPTKLLTIRV